jgi:hypothetical protein
MSSLQAKDRRSLETFLGTAQRPSPPSLFTEMKLLLISQFSTSFALAGGDRFSMEQLCAQWLGAPKTSGKRAQCAA